MASDGWDIFIWWGSGSPPCWRVLITLHEKQLTKYGDKLITFFKGEHKGPDIMAVNPRGQVPTLKHGETPVNESLAACIYLEDMFKGQGVQLIPDNPTEKALVLQRYHEAAVNYQSKLVERLVHWARDTKPGEEALNERKKALADELRLWEGYLAKLGEGTHIAGKQFSLADTTFWTFLAYCVRIGLQFDSSQVPNLKAYYDRVKQRPSVQKTWPPHWQEAPGEPMLAGIWEL